ncbi:unnamed protein product [Gadus morhua 'NCC']
MLLAPAVVVWEWLNEHGRWRPYGPAVSHHIEAAIRNSDPRGGSVVLGQVDSRLSPYIIDLQSMHQFRQDTGTIRPVRRCFYEPGTAPAQGVQWEWESSTGAWTTYDMEASIAIHKAHSRQQAGLDLEPLGLAQLIDFSTMDPGEQAERAVSEAAAARGHGLPPGVGAPSPAERPAPPRSATLGHAPRQSCDWQLPHGLAISRNTASPRKNAQLFAQSLAALSVSSALTSGSADRPSRSANRDAPHADRPWPIATLGDPATVVTTAPLPRSVSLSRVMKPNGDVSLVPLPRRSSLAGLSRPALQRIARAQNRTLAGCWGALSVPLLVSMHSDGAGKEHQALQSDTASPSRTTPSSPRTCSDRSRGFTSCCRKTSKKQTRKGRSPRTVVRRYVLKVKTPQDQDCPICMDPLAGPAGYVGPQTGSSARADTVVRLAECGHVQHLGCLLAHYDASCRDGSLQCAICKTVYGVRTGNQPAGKMQFHVIPPSLPGYPDCKTIRIVYNIPAGTQGPEDVNPGKPFTARGFPRHCYLPDTPKGRQVLGLLVVAWERRLVFTVGRSCTSGEEDTVVWNQVHHKTEFGSNLTGHGYPDPGHLDSMVDQLRALGVGPDDLL